MYVRLIIAGTRDFNSFESLEREVIDFLEELNGGSAKGTEIISGTARGADKLGEKFARKYSLTLTKCPANWDEYGKSAGYRRNVDMADYANACIVFWDGESKGTKHMIDIAKRKDLKLKIVMY